MVTARAIWDDDMSRTWWSAKVVWFRWGSHLVRAYFWYWSTTKVWGLSSILPNQSL